MSRPPENFIQQPGETGWSVLEATPERFIRLTAKMNGATIAVNTKYVVLVGPSTLVPATELGFVDGSSVYVVEDFADVMAALEDPA
jgi:hypothetical protein